MLWLNNGADMNKNIYEELPNNYTVNAKGWELFKARLFGKRYSDLLITAYLYNNKWYITRLG